MGSPPDDHFNPRPPATLHLDLNSCFATVEQQANPFLRGRPIAVAARLVPTGCVIAPSVEAKREGCKVGMTIAECRVRCPDLVVLPPDPQKYRHVHLRLRQLLGEYSPVVVPLSIDEFALDCAGTPASRRGLVAVAGEIKARIKAEIGSYLTVSAGIANNRFLAKTAAGLHKPDGLDLIDRGNHREILAALGLTDLTGINTGYARRLREAGILSVAQLLDCGSGELRRAFRGILGHHWYARLRGWEIDDRHFARHSFGQSYVLPRHLIADGDILPILAKLVEKMGTRLRRNRFRARGVYLAIQYRGFDLWHRARRLPVPIDDPSNLHREIAALHAAAPRDEVARLAVACLDVTDARRTQLLLLPGEQEAADRRARRVAAIDRANEQYGPWTVFPARMLGTEDEVQDRISFGSVEEIAQVLTKGGALAGD